MVAGRLALVRVLLNGMVEASALEGRKEGRREGSGAECGRPKRYGKSNGVGRHRTTERERQGSLDGSAYLLDVGDDERRGA